MTTPTPPKPRDPARPRTCAHGNLTQPKAMHPAWMGRGWWQDYAADCVACDGKAAGIPYKPGERPEKPIAHKEGNDEKRERD